MIYISFEVVGQISVKYSDTPVINHSNNFNVYIQGTGMYTRLEFFITVPADVQSLTGARSAAGIVMASV